jgi:hypothetical protein
MKWFTRQEVSQLCDPTEHRFEQPVYKNNTEHQIVGYLCTFCGLIAPANLPEKM